ncbi:MAG TPA: patatin-like phospholipase family protein [Polyangia bacterium]|nr:patatin-like phospholipase family protein [Polyangia bacterium]
MALATSCAHKPAAFDPKARRTCLVLSVGGARGVAHLGAIAAARQAGVRVDCVVGNSMGSLVGGLYASAPDQDTTQRFRHMAQAYVAASTGEASRNGILLGLALGAVAAVATDIKAAPIVAAAGGFALGAGLTPKMDRDRLVRVLDAELAGARIEALPLPYATSFQRRAGDGLELVVAREGNLAATIGKSLANPYIFDHLELARTPDIDPGADRAAMTPVDEACRLFPGANILAINVTDQPAFYRADMTCPLREVRVPVADVNPEAVFRMQGAFDDTVRAGYDATLAALK